LALTATVYHVDLTRGTVETKTLPEDIYRKYPGGSALAAYLLLQAMPAVLSAQRTSRIITISTIRQNQKEIGTNNVYAVFSQRKTFPEEWPIKLIMKYEKPVGRTAYYLFELLPKE